MTVALTPLGLELPADAAVLGMITGLTYGLLAVGLVIVYRTNRIINFAHGEIGAFAAAMFGLAADRWHVPYYVNLPLALAVGAAVAGLAEVAVIRRLRSAPPLMSVVATLGVGQFLAVLAVVINAQAGAGLIFPEPPGLPFFNVGALRVTPAYTGILFFAPIVVVGLAVFLKRSVFGLALRSAAANPEAARMAGVPASRMSSLAWAIAGALSTFTAILVLPTTSSLAVGAFGPGLLLRALVGAVLARMANLPVALVSGMALGLAEGLLLRNYPRGGVVEVVLFVVIVVALLLQTRGGSGREQEKGSTWASVEPWRPLPEAVARLRTVRALAPATAAAALVLLVLLPLGITNANAITVTSIMGITTVAISVSVITGLGGQLTLGQFALGAVGAVVSAQVARRTGGPLLLPLLYGGLAAAAASMLIGLPALRIKGLFLTVTTLAFAIVVPEWGLEQPWALGESLAPGKPEILGNVLDGGRSYYYFVLAVFVAMFMVARNVRRAGFGRLLLAVRDGEDNARAFTVPVARVKLQGYLLAGFIAGVGGAAYGHAFSTIQPSTFLTRYSIDVVVMSVVGGVAVLAGPVLGALFVLAVPAFVPLDSAGLAATRFGLLIVILYAPGGIAQMVAPLRKWVIERLARREGLSSAETDDGTEAASGETGLADFRVATAALGVNGHRRAPRVGRPLLEAGDLHKRFGGVAALAGVSLEVRAGETLGLIGPNGAGKTTLFEVLAGFTRPDRGWVALDREDVTKMSPEGRGRLGLIRSFQDAALFPTMTVLDTVQVAMERAMPTGFIAALAGGRGGDRTKERVARDLVGSMGLWPYRNKQIQELSTGTRRFTELACMVALQPRLLLLDEPSSGIAQRESEALGSLLEDLKRQLDMTLVIIEHDIPLVMRLSDRIVAMDAGRVIAAGLPAAVRNDPAVVESYLGGRIEAIERSGLVSGAAHNGGASDLSGIRGLGEARQQALLAAFGSVEAIRHAPASELCLVPGIGPALAERILAELGPVGAGEKGTQG